MPEIKAERSVDRDGDRATRCRESENRADQGTDGRPCVGNKLRVKSAMLRDGADRCVGADEEDLLESQQDPIKLAVEGLQEQPEFGAKQEFSKVKWMKERLAGLRLDRDCWMVQSVS